MVQTPLRAQRRPSVLVRLPTVAEPRPHVAVDLFDGQGLAKNRATSSWRRVTGAGGSALRKRRPYPIVAVAGRAGHHAAVLSVESVARRPAECEDRQRTWKPANAPMPRRCSASMRAATTGPRARQRDRSMITQLNASPTTSTPAELDVPTAPRSGTTELLDEHTAGHRPLYQHRRGAVARPGVASRSAA